jgi:hypothetical protein
MKGVKHPTEEARLEALRASQRKYGATEKGIAKYARYRETEGYADAQASYAERVDKSAVAMAWAKANPIRKRGNHRRYLLKKYGLTPEQFRDMEVGQAGRCLVCLRVPPKPLHVDHDHETGRVRGLLCGPCNRMLGLARDDSGLLARAARYVS